jgi:hypothetical protein
VTSRFGADVAKWVGRAKGAIDADVRAIEIALFSAIIKATPVDTGRARGNWQASIDRPEYSAIEREDPQGTAAIADMIGKIGGAGVVTWLSNNLPYIEVLEYGQYPNPPKRGTRVKGGGYEVRTVGGFSRQAPAGMVRINMARIDQLVREALGSGGA